MTSIEDEAFLGCSGLKDVYCFATSIPQNSSSSVFSGFPLASATLHVPASALNTYKSISPWSGFGSIVPLSSYKLTYMVDGEECLTQEVGEGTKVTAAKEPTKEGYTFSGWSEVPATMPSHDVTITGNFTLGTGIAAPNGENETFQIFTLDGRRVDTLQKGINILKMADGSTRKVMVK